MEASKSRVGSSAIYAIGILFAVAATIWCVHTALFLARSTTVEGEIIGFAKVAAKGGWSSHPVFNFRDNTGHRWEGTANYSSSAFSIGQRVGVIYDPEAPMQSLLNTRRAKWGGPLLVFFWSGLFFAFAWRIRKKERSSTPARAVAKSR